MPAPAATLVDPAELIGLNDVAAMLGCSISLANYHANRPGFPEAIATVGRSRIWTRPAVAAWAETRTPKAEPEAS